MLALHKQLPEAHTPHEKTALQRRIEATDGQIDRGPSVGPTEEEIGILKDSSIAKWLKIILFEIFIVDSLWPLRYSTLL
jgi:hypothetical protein